MNTFRSIVGLVILIALFGCSKEVADWNAPEIGAWIQEEWQLAEIEVTDHGDGTYSAVGKNHGGETFTFEIEKHTELKELHCVRTSGEGGGPSARALKKY